MTRSKEYEQADLFKRYLLRQIANGKKLGWDDKDLPLSVHTLEVVKAKYDQYCSKYVVLVRKCNS